MVSSVEPFLIFLERLGRSFAGNSLSCFVYGICSRPLTFATYMIKANVLCLFACMADSLPNMADSFFWALTCLPGNTYINLFTAFSVLVTEIVLWIVG